MNIHLVQMSHTDLGYTDSRERIREAYADFLCQALDLVEAYRDYPEGAQFRWTVETAWALRQFVERKPERIPDLVQAVKDRSIELTANYMHFTDLIDPALLKESSRWLRDFLQEHGLSVRVATHNDINGFPSALPALLRSMGVEFLATGMNATLALDMGPRHRIAQWTALDGTSIPVWYGDHYNLGNWMALSPSNMDEIFGRPTWPFEGRRDRADDLYPNTVKHTGNFITQLQNQKYPWSCVLVQCAGLLADNSPPDAVMCDLVRRFNDEQPLGSDVRVIVSSLEDFFDELSREMPDHPEAVEAWNGAWPDYWALGLGASPDEVKSVRRAQALLPAAQALHAAHDRDGEEAGEKALLALEHTFGAYDSVMQWYGANARQQWCLKQETFYRAEQLCDGMVERAELAAVRTRPLEDGEALLLNPLGLTGKVCRGIIQLPHAWTDGDPSPKLGLDHESIAMQRLSSYDHNYGRQSKGGHWLFRATPDGEREKRVRRMSTVQTTSTTGSLSRGDLLENDWIRIELDRKRLGLRIVRNRHSGRDYINPAMIPLGAVLHERHPQIHRPPRTEFDQETKSWMPAMRSINPEAGVRRVYAEPLGQTTCVRGPLFDEISIGGTLASYASLNLTVRLHHADGCVELIYAGIKQWLNEPNADHVYLGGDFHPPRFLLETSGGLFEPGKQQVPGSCLDFFTVQHCAVVHDEWDALVVDPVDAPLMQVGQSTLGAWYRKLPAPNPYLVSNFYNNLWFTNFPTAHSGPISSRYVLRFGPLADLSAHGEAIRDCAHPPLFGYAGEKRLSLPFPYLG